MLSTSVIFSEGLKKNSPQTNDPQATQLMYCTISANFLNISQLGASKARAIFTISSNLFFLQSRTKSVLQTKSSPPF